MVGPHCDAPPGREVAGTLEVGAAEALLSRAAMVASLSVGLPVVELALSPGWR